ncbi:MAG: hypothetical protein MHM6MM_000762 [Cercozoa sp. M6MM]
MESELIDWGPLPLTFTFWTLCMLFTLLVYLILLDRMLGLLLSPFLSPLCSWLLGTRVVVSIGAFRLSLLGGRVEVRDVRVVCDAFTLRAVSLSVLLCWWRVQVRDGAVFAADVPFRCTIEMAGAEIVVFASPAIHEKLLQIVRFRRGEDARLEVPLTNLPSSTLPELYDWLPAVLLLLRDCAVVLGTPECESLLSLRVSHAQVAHTASVQPLRLKASTYRRTFLNPSLSPFWDCPVEEEEEEEQTYMSGLPGHLELVHFDEVPSRALDCTRAEVCYHLVCTLTGVTVAVHRNHTCTIETSNEYVQGAAQFLAFTNDHIFEQSIGTHLERKQAYKKPNPENVTNGTEVNANEPITVLECDHITLHSRNRSLDIDCHSDIAFVEQGRTLRAVLELWQTLLPCSMEDLPVVEHTGAFAQVLESSPVFFDLNLHFLHNVKAAIGPLHLSIAGGTVDMCFPWALLCGESNAVASVTAQLQELRGSFCDEYRSLCHGTQEWLQADTLQLDFRDRWPRVYQQPSHRQLSLKINNANMSFNRRHVDLWAAFVDALGSAPVTRELFVPAMLALRVELDKAQCDFSCNPENALFDENDKAGPVLRLKSEYVRSDTLFDWMQMKPLVSRTPFRVLFGNASSCNSNTSFDIFSGTDIYADLEGIDKTEVDSDSFISSKHVRLESMQEHITLEFVVPHRECKTLTLPLATLRSFEWFSAYEYDEMEVEALDTLRMSLDFDPVSLSLSAESLPLLLHFLNNTFLDALCPVPVDELVNGRNPTPLWKLEERRSVQEARQFVFAMSLRIRPTVLRLSDDESLRLQTGSTMNLHVSDEYMKLKVDVAPVSVALLQGDWMPVLHACEFVMESAYGAMPVNALQVRHVSACIRPVQPSDQVHVSLHQTVALVDMLLHSAVALMDAPVCSDTPDVPKRLSHSSFRELEPSYTLSFDIKMDPINFNLSLCDNDETRIVMALYCGSVILRTHRDRHVLRCTDFRASIDTLRVHASAVTHAVPHSNPVVERTDGTLHVPFRRVYAQRVAALKNRECNVSEATQLGFHVPHVLVTNEGTRDMPALLTRYSRLLATARIWMLDNEYAWVRHVRHLLIPDSPKTSDSSALVRVTELTVSLKLHADLSISVQSEGLVWDRGALSCETLDVALMCGQHYEVCTVHVSDMTYNNIVTCTVIDDDTNIDTAIAIANSDLNLTRVSVFVGDSMNHLLRTRRSFDALANRLHTCTLLLSHADALGRIGAASSALRHLTRLGEEFIDTYDDSVALHRALTTLTEHTKGYKTDNTASGRDDIIRALWCSIHAARHLSSFARRSHRVFRSKLASTYFATDSKIDVRQLVMARHRVSRDFAAAVAEASQLNSEILGMASILISFASGKTRASFGSHNGTNYSRMKLSLQHLDVECEQTRHIRRERFELRQLSLYRTFTPELDDVHVDLRALRLSVSPSDLVELLLPLMQNDSNAEDADDAASNTARTQTLQVHTQQKQNAWFPQSAHVTVHSVHLALENMSTLAAECVLHKTRLSLPSRTLVEKLEVCNLARMQLRVFDTLRLSENKREELVVLMLSQLQVHSRDYLVKRAADTTESESKLDTSFDSMVSVHSCEGDNGRFNVRAKCLTQVWHLPRLLSITQVDQLRQCVNSVTRFVSAVSPKFVQRHDSTASQRTVKFEDEDIVEASFTIDSCINTVQLLPQLRVKQRMSMSTQMCSSSSTLRLQQQRMWIHESNDATLDMTARSISTSSTVVTDVDEEDDSAIELPDVMCVMRARSLRCDVSDTDIRVDDSLESLMHRVRRHAASLSQLLSRSPLLPLLQRQQTKAQETPEKTWWHTWQLHTTLRSLRFSTSVTRVSEDECIGHFSALTVNCTQPSFRSYLGNASLSMVANVTVIRTVPTGSSVEADSADRSTDRIELRVPLSVRKQERHVTTLLSPVITASLNGHFVSDHSVSGRFIRDQSRGQSSDQQQQRLCSSTVNKAVAFLESCGVSDVTLKLVDAAIDMRIHEDGYSTKCSLFELTVCAEDDEYELNSADDSGGVVLDCDVVCRDVAFEIPQLMRLECVEQKLAASLGAAECIVLQVDARTSPLQLHVDCNQLQRVLPLLHLVRNNNNKAATTDSVTDGSDRQCSFEYLVSYRCEGGTLHADTVGGKVTTVTLPLPDVLLSASNVAQQGSSTLTVKQPNTQVLVSHDMLNTVRHVVHFVDTHVPKPVTRASGTVADVRSLAVTVLKTRITCLLQDSSNVTTGMIPVHLSLLHDATFSAMHDCSVPLKVEIEDVATVEVPTVLQPPCDDKSDLNTRLDVKLEITAKSLERMATISNFLREAKLHDFLSKKPETSESGGVAVIWESVTVESATVVISSRIDSYKTVRDIPRFDLTVKGGMSVLHLRASSAALALHTVELTLDVANGTVCLEGLVQGLDAQRHVHPEDTSRGTVDFGFSQFSLSLFAPILDLSQVPEKQGSYLAMVRFGAVECFGEIALEGDVQSLRADVDVTEEVKVAVSPQVISSVAHLLDKWHHLQELRRVLPTLPSFLRPLESPLFKEETEEETPSHCIVNVNTRVVTLFVTDTRRRRVFAAALRALAAEVSVDESERFVQLSVGDAVLPRKRERALLGFWAGVWPSREFALVGTSLLKQRVWPSPEHGYSWLESASVRLSAVFRRYLDKYRTEASANWGAVRLFSETLSVQELVEAVTSEADFAKKILQRYWQQEEVKDRAPTTTFMRQETSLDVDWERVTLWPRVLDPLLDVYGRRPSLALLQALFDASQAVASAGDTILRTRRRLQ